MQAYFERLRQTGGKDVTPQDLKDAQARFNADLTVLWEDITSKLKPLGRVTKLDFMVITKPNHLGIPIDTQYVGRKGSIPDHESHNYARVFVGLEKTGISRAIYKRMNEEKDMVAVALEGVNDKGEKLGHEYYFLTHNHLGVRAFFTSHLIPERQLRWPEDQHRLALIRYVANDVLALR